MTTTATTRTTDLVATTREGYLFAWRTQGKADAIEWPTYHHDDQRTGHYGTPR